MTRSPDDPIILLPTRQERTYLEEQEPQGWRELRSKLQTESNPDRFQALLDQINRLLSTHEKANRQERTM